MKLTKEEFIKRAQIKHGDFYDYSKVIYENSINKIIITCKIHGDFEQKPSNHIRGYSCAKCSCNVKLTTDEFINRSKIKHNDFYDYSKVIYKNYINKVIIICPKHGEFEQTPANHLKGKNCLKCNKENKRLTTEEFINKAKIKHGELYDYSKAVYKKATSKVIITCKTHGDFEQNSSDHLRGHGCSNCAGKIKSTTDEFINRSKIKHNELYDYSKVIYKNANSKVIITCKIHGDFEQKPKDHLEGNICLKCSINNKYLTTEEFIKRSKIKHRELYDYSKAVYKNSMSNVIIICPKHGEFKQRASHHYNGSGCPACSKICSNVSINWLNYIQYTINKEIQNMLSPSGEYIIPTTLYKADGYCKETNTVYEFHGDFWHGNPKVFNKDILNPITKKTYGELYELTQNKKKKIMELGYNYVEMWEYDWDKAIKSIIKIQKIWKNYLKKIPKNQ